jgi:hypothetical protein
LAKEKVYPSTVAIKASRQTLVEEVRGFRKISDTIYSRNLPEVSQDRMIDICYWLWDNYPMAKWIINVIVSFIIAEELPFESPNPKVMKILKEFWYDPVNRLDLYLRKHLTEILVFGDILFPVKVSTANGRVRMGYIDPKQISEVIVDPENCKIQIGVKVKNLPGEPDKYYKIILGKDVEDFLSPQAKNLRQTFTTGDCFFFSINNVTNSPRGRSELFTIADWIDIYEHYLYDYAEKWSQLNNFIWDLQIEGADEKVIQEKVDILAKVSGTPGNVFGHNESIKLNAVTPELQSPDVREGAKIIRNHILGGIGFPTHWYGGAEDVNKSSADEMMIPTMKILTEKQNYFKYILSSIFDYQIYCAKTYNKIEYGDLTEENTKYTIITPELSIKDLTKFGAIIKNVADGLAVAESRGWIDKTAALESFAIMMSFLGKKVDTEQIKNRLEGNNNERNRK